MRTHLFLGLLLSSVSCDPAKDALPACSAGAYVGFYEDGSPACQHLDPGATAPVPVCSYDEALMADGERVRCAPRTDATDLKGIEAQLKALELELSTLQGMVDAPENLTSPLYVGHTTTRTTGAMTANGLTGIQGGAELCSAVYGLGSHPCTPYELARSVSGRILKDGAQIERAWIYFPAWNEAANLVESERSLGVGDTCDSYTNQRGSPEFRGVQMEWTTLSTGTTGLVLHGGSDARCILQAPIACCR